MEGAPYLAYGACLTAGKACAWADPDEAPVQFHVIEDGRKESYLVSGSRTKDDGSWEFRFPAGYEKCRCIGVVWEPASGRINARVLDMPAADIRRFGKNDGGATLVTVEKARAAVTTNGHIWRHFDF